VGVEAARAETRGEPELAEALKASEQPFELHHLLWPERRLDAVMVRVDALLEPHSRFQAKVADENQDLATVLSVNGSLDQSPAHELVDVLVSAGPLSSASSASSPIEADWLCERPQTGRCRGENRPASSIPGCGRRPIVPRIDAFLSHFRVIICQNKQILDLEK